MNVVTRRKLVPGAALAAAGLCIAMLASARGQENPATQRTIHPLVQISGPESKITERSYHLVTSAAGWNKLWHKHAGTPVTDVNETDVPWINFDKCVLVAIFNGPKVSDKGLVVHTVVEQTDQVVLRFDHRHYGVRIPFNERNKPLKKETPFGFFVLPRSSKPIVLEEAEYADKNNPPVFKQVARLTL